MPSTMAWNSLASSTPAQIAMVSSALGPLEAAAVVAAPEAAVVAAPAAVVAALAAVVAAPAAVVAAPEAAVVAAPEAAVVAAPEAAVVAAGALVGAAVLSPHAARTRLKISSKLVKAHFLLESIIFFS